MKVEQDGGPRRRQGTARRVTRTLLMLALAGSGLRAQPAAASPQAAAAPAKKTVPAAKKPAAPKTQAIAPAKVAEFKKASTDAETARAAGHLDEAVTLYRQALAIKPAWPEGLWGLGTSLYELEQFDPARDAFRRYIAIDDKNGNAWALKGLCEYRVKNYDTALSDLLQGRARGVTAGQQVAEVARYHTAVLSSRVER